MAHKPGELEAEQPKPVGTSTRCNGSGSGRSSDAASAQSRAGKAQHHRSLVPVDQDTRHMAMATEQTVPGIHQKDDRGGGSRPSAFRRCGRCAISGAHGERGYIRAIPGSPLLSKSLFAILHPLSQAPCWCRWVARWPSASGTQRAFQRRPSRTGIRLPWDMAWARRVIGVPSRRASSRKKL
jgi:hypothetical protein